ncbi:MAG: proteasome subunit beta [archaeon]
MKDVLKTGTTTVGLMCKDAVVLAADKRATAGHFIVDKKVEKVVPINDKMALTMAGVVSDVQLLIKLIKAELKLKSLRTNRDSTVKEAANLLSGMVYSNIRKMSMIPGISHFLLGGTDSSGVHLFDLYPDGSITDIDDFVSSGSGSVIAYGVLEGDYKKDLSKEEGINLAIKALSAAMQRDSASGQGVDVYVITKKGVEKAAQKLVDTRLH